MLKFKKPKLEPKVSAGSMADIAFLLLIFFLVATNLLQDKGLIMQLPPEAPPTITKIKERNLYTIQINSKNQFLIEGKIRENLNNVTQEIKEFVLNPQHQSSLSETPQKAIISVKANRGTKYKHFVETLDQIKQAYYEMYGEKVNLSADEFRKLNRKDPHQDHLYLLARQNLPMNISIAEPDKIK
ncbi:ExbD/TolR family protein [Reichenbachiella versicolor]|uniref:ExbD/TolR family protein n=1 Tax=Reichenbachiella versicolor TaxID=1821036 RepID=UPI000D6E102A|nr:biopolymer transporter ExbD [Reichenbachiella versicolor]